MEPYRSYFPHSGLLLPATERLASRVLSLPTGQTIEPEIIGKICEIIRFVVAHGSEIKQKLRAQTEGYFF
jgi:dTDP-4-amino-4,6-dideoxygalactose transaminase